jgi:hypothetical protein
VKLIAEFDAGDPEATLHALADEILAAAALERMLINRDCSAIAGCRKRRVRIERRRKFRRSSSAVATSRDGDRSYAR